MQSPCIQLTYLQTACNYFYIPRSVCQIAPESLYLTNTATDFRKSCIEAGSLLQQSQLTGCAGRLTDLLVSACIGSCPRDMLVAPTNLMTMSGGTRNSLLMSATLRSAGNCRNSAYATGCIRMTGTGCTCQHHLQGVWNSLLLPYKLRIICIHPQVPTKRFLTPSKLCIKTGTLDSNLRSLDIMVETLHLSGLLSRDHHAIYKSTTASTDHSATCRQAKKCLTAGTGHQAGHSTSLYSGIQEKLK